MPCSAHPKLDGLPPGEVDPISYTHLHLKRMPLGILLANDDCMVINDAQDDVHALIAYVFRQRKQCRIRILGLTALLTLFCLNMPGRSIHFMGESIYPRTAEPRESIQGVQPPIDTGTF